MPTNRASTATPRRLGLTYNAQRGYWTGRTAASLAPVDARRHSSLFGPTTQTNIEGWTVVRVESGEHEGDTWAFRA